MTAGCPPLALLVLGCIQTGRVDCLYHPTRNCKRQAVKKLQALLNCTICGAQQKVVWVCAVLASAVIRSGANLPAIVQDSVRRQQGDAILERSKRSALQGLQHIVEEWHLMLQERRTCQ